MPIRNLVVEHAISHLTAICPNCQVNLTRGDLPAHAAVCPRRPICCSGAHGADGCDWVGAFEEKVAHEESCVRLICRQMVDRRDAERANETRALRQGMVRLQERMTTLESRVESLEPLAAVGRHAAPVLLPHALTMCASTDVDIACEGTDALAALVHAASTHALRSPLMRSAVLSTVEAMSNHRQSSRVQAESCRVLMKLAPAAEIVTGEIECAADAGALEAIVAGLRAHEAVARVQQHGFDALYNIVCGGDDGVDARAQRAVYAGALEAIVAGLRAHEAVADVQEHGFDALYSIVCGEDDGADARRQRAAGAGALEAIVAGLRAHEAVADVQQNGRRTLLCIVSGDGARRLAAIAAGALAGWLPI